jgi:hypothetical protein
MFKYTDLMKPEQITIETCWKVFAHAIFKGQATVGRIQFEEMKKAFYGGFSECFKIINDVSEALPEEQAYQVLDRLTREGNAFVEAFLAEYPPGPRGQYD